MTQPSDHEIRERVRSYLRDTVLYMRPGFKLDDEDRLIQKRIVDSMSAVELIQFLESAFEVAVGDDDITESNLGSVAAIARFVLSKRSGDSGPPTRDNGR